MGYLIFFLLIVILSIFSLLKPEYFKWFRFPKLPSFPKWEWKRVPKANPLQLELEFWKQRAIAAELEAKTWQEKAPKMAFEMFGQYKNEELVRIREELYKNADKNAEDKYKLELERWKEQWELYFRQDAIQRSQSVILGKVSEHLIPFSGAFPFNPKDARFIGSPIDLIVFDGCDAEEPITIYIIEVKTGNSGLSTRQRTIREAVETGKIKWREIRI